MGFCYAFQFVFSNGESVNSSEELIPQMSDGFGIGTLEFDTELFARSLRANGFVLEYLKGLLSKSELLKRVGVFVDILL